MHGLAEDGMGEKSPELGQLENLDVDIQGLSLM